MLGKTVVILLVLAVALAVGAVLRSGAPLTDPPGLNARLARYLTENLAATSPHPDYPELEERRYAVPPEPMLKRVRATFADLGWEVSAEEHHQRIIEAVVRTELLGFKDDFTVTVHPMPDGGSRLSIRSASRMGKGDFGANIGHIVAFNRALAKRLPAQSAP
jgi:uncharacterized protein (DUF1499 family)